MGIGTRPSWRQFRAISCAVAIATGPLLAAPPAQAANPPSPPSMNLSSINATAIAGKQLLHNSPSTVILVGGNQLHVGPGTQLTPAEMVAVEQVLQAGHQGLVLSPSGAAIGGSLNLSSLGSQFSDLVIPSHVKVFDSAARPLIISNDLLTGGSLIGLLSGANRFSISAVDVSVLPSGSISTLNTAGRPLGLFIQSASDISNMGSILSSGSLVMQAAGGITNGSNALISAARSIYLVSGSGNFINAGSIGSTAGDITFNTITSADISVNNTGGQITAHLGDINIRTPDFTAKKATDIFGGDFMARNIDLFGGNGQVDANVDAFGGILNIYAGTSHVLANQSLEMGTVELTGDPSFVSTSGNLTLTSNQIFHGQNLALVAQGDVTATSKVKLIDVSNTKGNGGNLVIAAGFDMNIANGPPDPVTGKLPGGATATLTGVSTTGGNIYLPGVALKTGSTSANGQGGNVLLVAAESAGFTNGNVTVGSIDTSSPKGTAGIVTIYAPHATTIGTTQASTAIKASGGSGGGVDIFGQQPNWTTAPQFDSSGGMTNSFDNPGAETVFSTLTVTGKTDVSATKGAAGSIMVGEGSNIVDGAVNASTKASGALAGSINFSSANQSIKFTGPITATATQANSQGGFVNLHAAGTVDVNGNIDVHGGVGSGGVSITGPAPGSDRITITGSINTSASAPTGVGGDVTLHAGQASSTAAVEVEKGIIATGPAHGGNVTLLSDNSNVNVGFNSILVSNLPVTNLKGGIDTSSSAGQAGNIVLDTTNGGGMTGSNIYVGGLIKATSVNDGGQTHITINAPLSIHVAGGINGSASGSATANAANIQMNGEQFGLTQLLGIDVGAITDNGNNGSVGIASSGGHVLVTGNISVKAPILSTIGGNLTITPAGGLDILGNVDVSSGATGSPGTFITVVGDQTLATTMRVTGNVTGTGLTNATPGALMNFQAQTGVIIGGAVNDSGLFTGGNLTIKSADGVVTVGKGVSAAATNSLKTTVGGSITIQGSAVTVGGIVSVAGSNNSGQVKGGDAGQITITTLKDPSANASAGTIILGGVDARGGSTHSASSLQCGAGGTVDLVASAIRITTAGVGGSSIDASGGLCTSKVFGAPGTINISTTALQEVPTNFDLTSTKKSEVALPGGLFEVGNGSVNGSAGAIKIGTTVVTKTRVIGAPLSQGNVKILVGLNVASIVENLVSTPISSVNGIGSKAPRTMVTPGEALALVIATRNLGAQQFVLTNGVIQSGTIAGGNPGFIPAFEFDKPLTAFKLQTPNNVVLTLDLPSGHPTGNINLAHVTNPVIGQNTSLDFIDSSAGVIQRGLQISLGTSPLSVTGNGITDLIVKGTNLSLSGSTTASMVLAAPVTVAGSITMAASKTVSLAMGENSSITTNGALDLYSGSGSALGGTVNVQDTAKISSPSISQSNIILEGGTVTFGKHTGSSFVGPQLTNNSVPAVLAGSKFVSFFSGSDVTLIRATVESGGAFTLGSGSNVNVGSSPTPGGVLEAAGSMTILAGNNINFSVGSILGSGKDMLLQANGNVQEVGGNVSTFTSGGKLSMIGGSGINFSSIGEQYTSAKDMHIVASNGITWVGNATAGGVLTVGSLASAGIVNGGSTIIDGFTSAVGNVSVDAGSGAGQLSVTGQLDSSKGAVSLLGPNIGITGSCQIVGTNGVTVKLNGNGNITLAASDFIGSRKAILFDTSASSSGVISTGSGDQFIGGLGTPIFNAALPSTDVLSKGSITLNSHGTITIGASASFLSIGGSTTLVSSHGDINLGDGSVYQALGGNLSIMALDNITGGKASSATTNDFVATALVTGTKVTGGAIGIEAGVSFSALPAFIKTALANKSLIIAAPGTVGLLPSISLVAQTSGEIEVFQNAGATITLSNTKGYANAMNVSGGVTPSTAVNPVILVQASSGSSITLDSTNFLSITDVGCDSSETPGDDMLVDAADDE